ncbi:hypothetical protein DO72_4255 [Burkholderia pseudomallei]|nr:hypothetical protein DO72_4255 [Burkholderia pseudomallei]
MRRPIERGHREWLPAVRRASSTQPARVDGGSGHRSRQAAAPRRNNAKRTGRRAVDEPLGRLGIRPGSRSA